MLFQIIDVLIAAVACAELIKGAVNYTEDSGTPMVVIVSPLVLGVTFVSTCQTMNILTLLIWESHL